MNSVSVARGGRHPGMPGGAVRMDHDGCPPLTITLRHGIRGGFTLIEMAVAFSILAIVALACLQGITGIVMRNRQMSMEIASLQSINYIMGEVEAISESLYSQPSDESKAFLVVDYFRKLGGDTIDIGPNKSSLDRVELDPTTGRMIYRFWVPAPGEQNWSEDDSRFVKNHRALGEASIYLDETILNRDILPQFQWSDLSTGDQYIPKGLDLNLNGDLDDNLLNDYRDIKQLAMIITVTYYSDESHTQTLYSNWRNIMVTSIKIGTDKFDPTL